MICCNLTWHWDTHDPTRLTSVAWFECLEVEQAGASTLGVELDQLVIKFSSRGWVLQLCGVL